MLSSPSGFVLLMVRWRRALPWVVATGAPVAISTLLVPDMRGVFGVALALLMLAIAVAGARAFIIPDELTLAALILGVLALALAPSHTFAGDVTLAALRSAMLALAFLALRIGYRYLRGRQGIGLGDTKLAGVCGLWLAWLTIPIAVETAALSALSAYLVRQLALGRPTRATARSFAPQQSGRMADPRNTAPALVRLAPAGH
jgi:leader peptidase (prepilin peptidase) / N-methyltransferase